MSVVDRIRALVEESGGRAPVERIVQDVLGLAGAKAPLARRLLAATLAEARGLALEGDEVVLRSAAPHRVAVLALAPAVSATALPPAAAWLDVGGDARPVVVALAGEAWREGLVRLAGDLRGAEVHALSAASARRVLKLAELVARHDVDDEIEVVAIGSVARSLGHPLRGSEDAAALVGASVPESPEQAALLLARLVERLAELSGGPASALRDLAHAELVPPFDFGTRAFGRDDVLALPEAPGVYLFEDAAGDVAYVGKAQRLRRRVGSYFVARVEDRDSRIREAAHDLSHERTGSELSALLREQQLIRELHPALNVQAEVHARARSSVAQVAATGAVAIVQPSASGGAEVVLLDRALGAHVLEVVPEAGDHATRESLLAGLQALRKRAPSREGSADAEVALTWIADRGAAASLVDASGEPPRVAELLARLARDPDLREGRIVIG